MLPSATSPVQPVFVLAAVSIEQAYIHNLTYNFLDLKQNFFSGSRTTPHPRPLDLLKDVVKGADIRRMLRSTSRNQRRFALRFLGELLHLLTTFDVKIFGRVWIKGIGKPMNGKSIYTYSVQYICRCFQNLLTNTNQQGFVILDSRNKPKNTVVSHSIFTQKYKWEGDSYGRILEMPTFGHDENHVGLQIVDYICSCFLFPMAAYTYCSGHVQNVHVSPHYLKLKSYYGRHLKDLQHRFQRNNQWRGGITINDQLELRPGSHLFQY